jgi:hypothetical protein
MCFPITNINCNNIKTKQNPRAKNMELVAFMFTIVINKIQIMPFSLKLVTQNIHPNFLSIQKNPKGNNLAPIRFHQIFYVVPNTSMKKH